MISSSSALHRNSLSRTQHLKPLIAFWRSEKTKASPSKCCQTIQPEIKQDVVSVGVVTDVRAFEDIPGPKPGLKFMLDFYTKTKGFTKGTEFFERLFLEYGPIYKEDVMLNTSTVHVIDPEDFERVYRAEGKYPRRPPHFIDIWKEYRDRRNHLRGVVFSDGEEWHKARHAIAPKIMRPKIVEENIDNFNAVTKDAIVRFVQLKEACGSDNHIPDLEGELRRWSTESIGTVAFDVRLGLYEDPPPQEALRFIEEVTKFFELSRKLLFSVTSRIARQYVDTPTLKKFFKSNDTFLGIAQGFVDKKMRELKEMEEKGIDHSGNNQVVSLLTYLLTKEGLTIEEVNVHVTDILSAGVDTTSNTVLWWLYNLARFPHVQEKLYQEVESVVEKDGDVTPQNLAKLPYLKACLKESMRITPIIPNGSRILEQDTVLSGYRVPAQIGFLKIPRLTRHTTVHQVYIHAVSARENETCVMMELHCTNRSEKYFKDPMEFKPERWLRENKDEINAFSHLQFGFGPRMCAGRRVAELEMYVFICKLLQRFRLEYHHEPLEFYQKLVNVPDKPVKIKFLDRL